AAELPVNAGCYDRAVWTCRYPFLGRRCVVESCGQSPAPSVTRESGNSMNLLNRIIGEDLDAVQLLAVAFPRLIDLHEEAVKNPVFVQMPVHLVLRSGRRVLRRS